MPRPKVEGQGWVERKNRAWWERARSAVYLRVLACKGSKHARWYVTRVATKHEDKIVKLIKIMATEPKSQLIE